MLCIYITGEWTPITTPDGWVLLPSVTPSTTLPSSSISSTSPDTTTLGVSTLNSQGNPELLYIINFDKKTKSSANLTRNKSFLLSLYRCS